jgi:hypothetical protein
MKNRKQQLILLTGIAIAALLILSNFDWTDKNSDIVPTTQKKPKFNTPALFDSLL